VPINSLKFAKIFLDKFHREYPELPSDVIADIIGTVLFEVPDSYFDYNLVQDHSEFCDQCGSCCKQRDQPCRYFNGKTCDEYESRFDVCAEFPYYEINGEEGLMMDPGCKFAIRLAEMQLEKEMKHNIELLFGEKNDY